MVDLNTGTTRLEKTLSWFALINGIFTLLMSVMASLIGIDIPMAASIIYALLGSGSFLAGFYGLAGRAWAYWLLFGVHLIQCAEYYSETLWFSLIGPLSVKIGWGWNDPPSAVNINLLAVVVCCLACNCAITSTERARKAVASPTLPGTV